jgi:hypothetical protein
MARETISQRLQREHKERTARIRREHEERMAQGAAEHEQFMRESRTTVAEQELRMAQITGEHPATIAAHEEALRRLRTVH